MPLQQLDTLLRFLLRRAGTPGDDLPDGALLEQFLCTRDEAAFTALVERHGPMVYGVCHRVLHHAQDAEDAFQATFLILARRAADLRRTDSVAGWLHIVATRLALRARADTARRPVADGGNLDMRAAEPDTTSLWHDLRPVLDEELQRLPEKYRVPVILCYLEGCTHADAARQLGWPKGTVAGRLARARELLRDRLTRRGVTLSSALLGGLLADHASAALPAGLAKAAVRGALTFAASSTAGISTQVLALTEGGLHAMFAAKVKVGAMLTVTLTLALAGAGVWAHQALREMPEEPSANAGPQLAQEEKPPARTDRYGDPLPEGAVARLGTVRWRTRGGTLVFSPDGKLLASSEDGPWVALWDVSTGKRLRRFAGAKFSMRPVAFFADSKRLLTVEQYGSEWQGVVQVWNAATGEELLKYNLSPRNPEARLSPDGKLLVGFGESGIRLYDPATGKELRVLEESRAQVVDVSAVSAISPDGRFVAGQLINATRNGLESIAWLWETATGKKVRRIGEPQSQFVGIAFSGNGRFLATGSYGGPIHLWDAATGQEIRRFLGHIDWVYKLAFTRDSKLLVSASAKSPIRVWDVATGREVRQFGLGSYSMVLSPDNRFVAATEHRAIRLYDFSTGTELHSLDGHRDGVSAAAFLEDSRVVASAGGRDGLWTWDVPTGRPLSRHAGEPGGSYRFSPDGQVLAYSAWSGKSVVALRDVADGTELRHIPLVGHGPHPQVSGLAFTADGKNLALSFGKPPMGMAKGEPGFTLGVWKVSTGKEVWRRTGLPTHGGIAFSPDGNLLALRVRLSGKSAVELWDASEGQPLYPLTATGGDDESRALAFSPDGRLLVSPSSRYANGSRENFLHMWEVVSGEERAVFAGSDSSLYSVVFSPDGRTFATACTKDTIRLWDVATCQERATLRGHDGSVHCLAFSRDGRYLVSGSADTTLLVWDLARVLPPKPRPAPPSTKAVEAAWADLARDAKVAHKAIHTLAAAPELTVPLLKERVKPAPVIPSEQLVQWVRELDDARFKVRERAQHELEMAGLAAEKQLAKALADKPSAEVRQQVEALQKKLRGPVTRVELLRDLRAVEVLELIGSAEARDVLKTLAEGADEARLTREVKATLRLLEKR